jgi:1-deoxy-D-xylulose-5-phosphate reductoisomerase
MVGFVDGSVLAQMGFPTMEIPIVYALSYPERIGHGCRRFDPLEARELSFEPVREEAFPAFALGVAAGRAGGGAPAVFNGANEVAVDAFLTGRIGFREIASAIEHTLEHWPGGMIDNVDAVFEADRWARSATATFIEKHALC